MSSDAQAEYGSRVMHIGVRPHSGRGQTFSRVTVALAGLALVVALAPVAWAQRPPVVAAASDLNVALAEIAGQFEHDTGHRVDTVFGSSGTLTRQIQDGAPFELFLSADEAFVDTLAAAGLTRGRGTLYGVGRIVLFAPTGSLLDPTTGLAGLARLVASGGVRRFDRAADAVLRRTATLAVAHPTAFGQLLVALELTDGMVGSGAAARLTEVVVAGRRPELVAAVQRRWLPSAVLAWGEPYPSPLWEGREPGWAYVCVGAACRLPVSEVADVDAQLDAVEGSRRA